MPGVLGIVGRLPAEQARTDLAQMLDCVKHESFYSSGTYENAELGLYAGWVSHENSFSDCMPVFNEKKDLVLILGGECFADEETINDLKKQGHDFESSNASYLIHLYEEDPKTFFESLNGWFSGVLVDLRNKSVVLFNDRYGMQRTYYHESKDALLFAPEAKALLKVRPELRQIDPNALGQYLYCRTALEHRSLFSGVSLLPEGSLWRFRDAKCEEKKLYFKPSDWENQPTLTADVFHEQLHETFRQVLPRYFSSAQPIAMSLTGGLDTRMILAGRENPRDTLPCYTFAGRGPRETLDVRLARRVAAACNQSHQTVPIDEEFLSNFAQYAEKTAYVTDGCFDVLGTHEVYLNGRAREIAPIRMTGNYGSEVFRAHSTYKPFAIREDLLHPDFRQYVKNAQPVFADMSSGHHLTFTAFREMPWNLFGCLAAGQSQLTLRTPYLDNDLVKLIYQSPLPTGSNSEMAARFISDGNRELLRIPTDSGIGGRTGLSFTRLKKLFRYVTFKFDYYYVDPPTWLAKLEGPITRLGLTRLVAGRHQFLHYRPWFRNELSDYALQILTDKSTTERPYWNGSLEKLVRDHIEGRDNNTFDIGKILTVELVHRLLIDS